MIEWIHFEVKTTKTAFLQVASAKDTFWSSKSNPKIEQVGAFHGLTVVISVKIKCDTQYKLEKRGRAFAGLDMAAGIVIKRHLESSPLRLQFLLTEKLK